MQKLEHKFKAEKDKYSNLPDPIPKSKKDLKPIVSVPKAKLKQMPKEVEKHEEKTVQERPKEISKNPNKKFNEFQPAQAIIQPQTVQPKTNQRQLESRSHWNENQLPAEAEYVMKKEYDIKPFKPVDECITFLSP